MFAEVAAARGVPREKMLLESRSTNTGENVVFTRALLEERGIVPARVIAVQKPYMERRTHATFQARWPGLDVIVTSPRLGLDEYVAGSVSRDDVLHIMVGDLQRLWLYAEKGWSAPQPVPAEVKRGLRRPRGRRLHAPAREGSAVNRFFELERHGTSVRREATAALATFLTMAYIVVVNPAVLEAAGLPRGASIDRDDPRPPPSARW